MRIIATVRGDVGPVDLWPYVARFTPTATGGVLIVSLHDRRELVSLLLMLSSRVEIVSVESFEEAADSGPGASPPEGDGVRCPSRHRGR